MIDFNKSKKCRTLNAMEIFKNPSQRNMREKNYSTNREGPDTTFLVYISKFH